MKTPAMELARTGAYNMLILPARCNNRGGYKNLDDAVLLVGNEAVADDQKLIGLLMRLGKTFGNREKYEQTEEQYNE